MSKKRRIGRPPLQDGRTETGYYRIQPAQKEWVRSMAALTGVSESIVADAALQLASENQSKVLKLIPSKAE